MKARAIKAAVVYAVVLGVLFVYYIFTQLTGIGIPCIFHKITGLDCPGCGNSRALVALSHFEVKKAADHNLFIFPELIFVGFISASVTVRYIKSGKVSLRLKHEWAGWVFLAVLIVWTVVRNVIR
jgi:hypothetical protein